MEKGSSKFISFQTSTVSFNLFLETQQPSLVMPEYIWCITQLQNIVLQSECKVLTTLHHPFKAYSIAYQVYMITVRRLYFTQSVLVIFIVRCAQAAGTARLCLDIPPQKTLNMVDATITLIGCFTFYTPHPLFM